MVDAHPLTVVVGVFLAWCVRLLDEAARSARRRELETGRASHVAPFAGSWRRMLLQRPAALIRRIEFLLAALAAPLKPVLVRSSQPAHAFSLPPGIHQS